MDQYVFVIRLDKDKIVKGNKYFIKEKWNLIAKFIRSQVSLVDPERLQSVTVMMPHFNVKNDLKSKKVKLLITLFLLLISDKYFLLQKSNGYLVLPKNGAQQEIFNAKQILSQYYLKTKFTMTKLIQLTQSTESTYNFDALKSLKPFRGTTFRMYSGLMSPIISRESMSQLDSPDYRPDGRISTPQQSPMSFSPLRRTNKRLTTRVDVNRLMKIFNIDDDCNESDNDSKLSQSDSPSIREEVQISPLVLPSLMLSSEQKINDSLQDIKESHPSPNFGALTSKKDILPNHGSFRSSFGMVQDSQDSNGAVSNQARDSPPTLIRSTKRSRFNRKQTRKQVNIHY